MCGIAGFSIRSAGAHDPALITRLFLAGLAERGEDACGYAFHGADGAVTIRKQAAAPHVFLQSEEFVIPPNVTSGIIHVRDHTKGKPSHDGNNHPIDHGAIVGVHNGIIQNDDELFTHFGRDRSLPGMSVDSEAIFMLCDLFPDYTRAFQELIGSYSIAFFDRRQPHDLFVARGKGRPLLVIEHKDMVLFASTRHALHFVCDRVGIAWTAYSMTTGTLLHVADGSIVKRSRFAVNSFDEHAPTEYTTSHPAAQRARMIADGFVDQADSL